MCVTICVTPPAAHTACCFGSHSVSAAHRVCPGPIPSQHYATHCGPSSRWLCLADLLSLTHTDSQYCLSYTQRTHPIHRLLPICAAGSALAGHRAAGGPVRAASGHRVLGGVGAAHCRALRLLPRRGTRAGRHACVRHSGRRAPVPFSGGVRGALQRRDGAVIILTTHTRNRILLLFHSPAPTGFNPCVAPCLSLGGLVCASECMHVHMRLTVVELCV